ncbi:hypothetical protein C0J52_05555 [Blattella germanica]|nr:hypothetical protein C0J52_05555 [Blattella germanica]
MVPYQITAPLIVLSNRLPFILERGPDGRLSRKARLLLYILKNSCIMHITMAFAMAYCAVNKQFALCTLDALRKTVKEHEQEKPETCPVVNDSKAACDMVGFHIEDYCLNFIDCCSRRLGCRVDRNNMLVELAGLVHRILSFERLLEKYPEHIEKVTFMQISVPSRTDVREYQQLKEEMDQLVGRINGRFTKPNWSPVKYIYGGVSQEQLASFYRDSAVALVTPLRDGMNLVAKEYVACQIKEPGVLILSPFAGAGGMMHEALVVNPYEIDKVADTINRALLMPLDEREVRMKQLRHREQQMDVNHWMSSFLATMGALDDDSEVDPLSAKMTPLTLDDFDQYLNNHIDTICKLSLILDYDGTLAPLTSHPDLAIMPEETKRVLERLSNMPDVNIAVISGRSLENVRKMVGLDQLTYAGSHGIEILHPDGTKFVHPVPFDYAEELRELVRELEKEVGHSGAWVEHKGVLLTYHYRETPANQREELVNKAIEIFEKAGFEPHEAHMAIEAKPPVKWDQGRACIHILRTMYGADWSERVRIVYAGTEAAMEALSGIACTFRVDSSPTVRTAANFRLEGPDAVLTMLKWIEKQMNKRSPRITRSPRLSRSPKHQRKQNMLDYSLSFEDEEDTKSNNSYLTNGRQSKFTLSSK